MFSLLESHAAKQALKFSVGQTMFCPGCQTLNYTEPSWAPLGAVVAAAGLPADTCGEFMWMFAEPASLHHYKHCDTRLYVVVHEHNPAISVEMLHAARRPWRTR